jgi:23S rRNA (adenine1618-N6)-methyltransferase
MAQYCMPKTIPPTNLLNAQHKNKTLLHPRNKHLGRYDFAQLIQNEASLAQWIITTEFGEQSIDFANPDAVKALNRALLKTFYALQEWDIPANQLCPPVPGRADYIHYLADLLASSNLNKQPKKKNIHVLDIGTGANGIYPLIGTHEYGWNFVASDINVSSLANVQKVIDANQKLKNQIELRLQPSANAIFKGIVQEDDWFDISMCNPPFHTSLAQAQEGSQRKWQKLGKLETTTSNTNKNAAPLLNFGGQDAELWCPGGELAFIQRMISESAKIPTRCFWFTSLVSQSANLPDIKIALKKAKVVEFKIVEMNQGNKQSRFIAWTFLNATQQAAWRKLRW